MHLRRPSDFLADVLTSLSSLSALESGILYMAKS